MGGWITDWALIDGEADYIVCPINACDDGTTYLAIGHVHIGKGWQVKRLTEHLYAALPLPAWGGGRPWEKKGGT